jgi:N-acetylglutamate synthase/N-acetylornithine aminotransferase
VCRELALGIVRGGEGATKLVTVNGVRLAARPRRVAAIANSLLVKTAFTVDPNWGRLIAWRARGVAFEPSGGHD